MGRKIAITKNKQMRRGEKGLSRQEVRTEEQTCVRVCVFYASSSRQTVSQSITVGQECGVVTPLYHRSLDGEMREDMRLYSRDEAQSHKWDF